MGLLNNNRTSPMHIMTDSSDFNDNDSIDDRPGNLRLKSKGTGRDIPEHGRQGSGESSNDGRLEKDRDTGDGADEGAIESSEEEEEAHSSDEEEESTPNRARGRGRDRADKSSEASGKESEDSDDDAYASVYGQTESTRQAKSALAAAEEERMF
jgi:hypothetical protein